MKDNMLDFNFDNPILNTDSYKLSHFPQYEPGTERVFSYGESRGGVFDEVLWAGIQPYLKKFLTVPITMHDVNQAEWFSRFHGFEDFNRKMWTRIVKKHNGFMPVVIKAAPEGLIIPTHNVLVTIENTDDQCAPVTSYLEQGLLRAVWYMTTVATTSYHAKKLIRAALEKTGSDDPEAELPHKLVDFGGRGVSSKESSGLGGLAHLLCFQATDNIEGILYAAKFYNVDLTDPAQMPGFSIPAAEHSTITSWGKDRELAAFTNMVDKFGKPGALFAVVSDSYDIYYAVRNLWGNLLKEKVINSKATLVVRPDSGDPVEVTLKVMQILDETYGTTVNNKGYKVLPDCVRIIQGDGIDVDMIGQILDNFEANGYSASNITFGMGGGLLQHSDRDTLKFAVKCSSMRIGGKDRDVFKDPITDKVKKSKKGRLMLFKDTKTGEYLTLRDTKQADWMVPVLRKVYENGKILVDENLETIRGRQLAT